MWAHTSRMERERERLKIYNFLMHPIVTIKSLRCDVIFSSHSLFFESVSFHIHAFRLNGFEDFILFSSPNGISNFIYAQHVGCVSQSIHVDALTSSLNCIHASIFADLRWDDSLRRSREVHTRRRSARTHLKLFSETSSHRQLNEGENEVSLIINLINIAEKYSFQWGEFIYKSRWYTWMRVDNDDTILSMILILLLPTKTKLGEWESQNQI